VEGMNIDIQLVFDLISEDWHQFIAAFLRKPILITPGQDAKEQA
jgi:hypothetical protein